MWKISVKAISVRGAVLGAGKVGGQRIFFLGMGVARYSVQRVPYLKNKAGRLGCKNQIARRAPIQPNLPDLAAPKIWC